VIGSLLDVPELLSLEMLGAGLVGIALFSRQYSWRVSRTQKLF